MTTLPTRAEARHAGMSRARLAAQRRRSEVARALNISGPLSRREYQRIATSVGGLRKAFP